MPDLVGPIQPLELASWLWLVLVLPFVGVLINTVYTSGWGGQILHAIRFGLADEDGPREKRPPRAIASAETSARVAVLSLGASALVGVVHASLLVPLASGHRFLLQPLWAIARVGQLDVGLALAFDPLAAILVVLVTGTGTAVAWSLAKKVASADEAWRLFAWLGAFVASLLLVLLADNVLVALVGWEAVALCGLGLVKASTVADPVRAGRLFLVRRAFEGALLVGVALLFWSLGGSWPREGGYQADLDPRVAAVAVTETDASSPPPDDPALHGAAATRGRGFLTATALPGALVYLDESRTPIVDESGLPLVTPFRRHPLEGGSHAFRLAPDDRFHSGGRESKVAYVLEGGVLANYSVGRIAIGGDREVALTLLGPTLSFREARDELALWGDQGASARRPHPLRDRVASRTILGVSLATLVSCLLLVATIARSTGLLALTVRERGGSAAEPIDGLTVLHGAGMLLAGAYLMARLWFLFALSPVARIVLEILAAGAALLAASALRQWRRAAVHE